MVLFLTYFKSLWQVIDDEADYYATGSAAWLSKDERVAVEVNRWEHRHMAWGVQKVRRHPASDLWAGHP
jgi:hypothetical protein